MLVAYGAFSMQQGIQSVVDSFVIFKTKEGMKYLLAFFIGK